MTDVTIPADKAKEHAAALRKSLELGLAVPADLVALAELLDPTPRTLLEEVTGLLREQMRRVQTDEQDAAEILALIRARVLDLCDTESYRHAENGRTFVFCGDVLALFPEEKP